MGRNWNEQERVGRGADDDGVGDQNVVDSDVDNNCDQSGERHDRENDGVAQAPFLMVAIAVAHFLRASPNSSRLVPILRYPSPIQSYSVPLLTHYTWLLEALTIERHICPLCPHANLRRKCLRCGHAALSASARACLSCSCVDLLSVASKVTCKPFVAFGKN